MSAARKRSIIDQRLRELEKESRLVQDDIRVLSRALKRSDRAIAWDRLKTARESLFEPEKTAEPERPGGRPEGELFQWKTAARGDASAPEPPRTPPRGGIEPAGRKRFEVDEQFASYFASGSFAPGGLGSESRAVQRNKAVFMAVVVAFVVFIVLKLLIW